MFVWSLIVKWLVICEAWMYLRLLALCGLLGLCLHANAT